METQSHLPQTNNKTFHSFLSVLSVYHSSQTQFRWEQKQTRICLSCQHCHWRTHSLHVLVWLQTRCVVNSLCSSFADVCCELSVFLFSWRVLWTLSVLLCWLSLSAVDKKINVIFLKFTCLFMSLLLTITGLGLLVLHCCYSFLCFPLVTEHLTRGLLPVVDGT